jgi:hypothetical protein
VHLDRYVVVRVTERFKTSHWFAIQNQPL